MSRWKNPTLALAALTLLANLALVVPAARYGGGFVLLWLLPGLAWWKLLSSHHRRPVADEIALGLGLGVASVAVITLLLHYIPGPLTLPMLLIAIDLLILVLLLLPLHLSASDHGFSNNHCTPSIVHCLLLILLAAFFRLTNLNYSEFQGDEGVIMVRAARVIQGDDAQLFYHQKGPAEVLLPVATWTLSGTINEWQARLPFAFAGILGIAAFYLLGCHWFNQRTAFISALLLAINGYFVGFGRVVQYQSLVLAATALALMAFYHWSEGRGKQWLIAGAALLAFGLLAHYDAVLVLPAAAFVVARRLWINPAQQRPPALVASVIGAAALAGIILAAFYLPFIRHPNFAKTLNYLGGSRIGSEGPLYNNLPSFLPLAIFYNSTCYLILLAGLVVVASLFLFHHLGLLIPAACYTFVLVDSLTRTSELTPWAGPVMAGLLGAILLSRRPSPPSRAAWLWFGVPFLFYYFLVWDPRTHVLNAFPGATLLAASALDTLISFLPSSDRHSVPLSARLAVTLPLLAVFLYLAYYPYMMFVQHNPEIKRTWPANRPTLYWKSETDGNSALFGFFGFPYRAGWKVVGRLIEEGIIDGVYASNEEPQVVGWYAHGAARTYCSGPDWYLIAEDVQDEVPIQWDEIDAAYYLWGEILTAGEAKLKLYRRGPALDTPSRFHAEISEHIALFDAQTTPAVVLRSPPADFVPAGHTLGEMVRLLGYELDTTDSYPGGFIGLVLHWEALQPIATNYQVFNHLYDGTMWGQQDGTPGCGLQPTVFWEPGQTIRDEYTVPIAASAPVGEMVLQVGMYDLATNERLSVRDSTGQSIGDSIPLAVVRIQ